MPTISFMVSSISKAKRETPINPVTDHREESPMWRVTLRCSWIPDRYVELWFLDEAQARKAPKGNISVEQLFQLMSPGDTKFIVGSIEQKRMIIGQNKYTDKPEWMDGWNVGLQQSGNDPGTMGGMAYADLIFPNSAEAAAWAWDEAYSAPDFLRAWRVLVPSAPAVPGANIGSGAGPAMPVSGYPKGFAPPGVSAATPLWYLSLPQVVQEYQFVILAFPTALYQSSYEANGFFDNQGYHVPGNYPLAVYPFGYELANVSESGSVSSASTPTGPITEELGVYGYLVSFSTSGETIRLLTGGTVTFS